MEQEHRKRMCLNYNLHNLGLDCKYFIIKKKIAFFKLIKK